MHRGCLLDEGADCQKTKVRPEVGFGKGRIGFDKWVVPRLLGAFNVVSKQHENRLDLGVGHRGQLFFHSRFFELLAGSRAEEDAIFHEAWIGLVVELPIH